MKEKRKEFFSVAIRIAVALTIFVCVIINYDRLVNLDLRKIISGISIYYACAVVLGVYALKSVVFVVPAMIIYVSVGAAFDLPVALILNLLGLSIEVTLTYLLGKFLGGEYVTKLLAKNKGGQKLLNMKSKTKNSLIFITRVVPAFPIDFTSLFFGSSSTKFIPYFFISLLGIYPRVLLFTIFGDGVYKLIPMGLIIKLIIVAIPVAVVGFIIYRVVKKRKKKESE